jgi:hypothetical protein
MLGAFAWIATPHEITALPGVPIAENDIMRHSGGTARLLPASNDTLRGNGG